LSTAVSKNLRKLHIRTAGAPERTFGARQHFHAAVCILHAFRYCTFWQNILMRQPFTIARPGARAFTRPAAKIFVS
jgi:hypothetical protein